MGEKNLYVIKILNNKVKNIHDHLNTTYPI